MLETTQASLFKAASGTGQFSGPLLHGSANTTANLQQIQSRPQQLSVTSQDNKNDVNLALSQRSPASDPSVFGVPGVCQPKSGLLSPGLSQGANALPLKGWPLAGIDQLRPGMAQSPKPFMQASQAYPQLHLLTPQQQQLLLQAQAQGNMSPSGSPLLTDMDPRKFRVLLGRSSLGGKDGQSNSLGDITQGGSPMQAASPLTRGSSQEQAELMMKMHRQQQSNQHLQQQQSSITLQQQQQQQDRLSAAGGISADGALSNSFRPNDQVYGSLEPSPSTNSTGTGKMKFVWKVSSKCPTGRKRKQPSSSGPANSTGTGNTAGPSPNSPSSPSTHTPGDVMPMGNVLQQSGSMSKPMMYGSDGVGTLASPCNQLADMERFGDDNSLDDNVESFLSHDEADAREGLFGSSKRSPAGHSLEVTKAFSFQEVGCLHASTSKVVCCHFSSDGKLLASAGHDKKAVLWNMDTLKLKSTLEEHSFLITDVRFSPNSARLATSSFDKTVRVWDADNPSYSLRTFQGHQTSVMSLDFHPNNEDLLCSCDGDSEIRYWSVNQGVCTRVFKGGMTQTRFQPRIGRLLAAAAENVVSIFDVETETCIHSLQRHTKPVHSVCWDATGDYVASVSEDSVRVWALGSGSDGECVHELSCNGNKFHSCVFHPNYPSLLVIGCYQSLELWNMAENKSMTVSAHEGLIAALAQSPATGMVASASHDKCVKLWK
ncbi:hypothetical protein O6H91_18G069300 [Diphasiastrum complanatum]|uniref:Uncharacterized protein n=1 Tax=Diphasiastrum complanatum TaxID=34168 RepID=A0ACC2B2F0_DIPCM|nr:hypothetical protein O6H91_18G069300 [Diphasiastrum complanatum]